MNTLISIDRRVIGSDMVETVNARDLHAFLEVGRDFSSWLRDRIVQYEFAENVDFVVFTKTGGNLSGGRPAKEYALSLDMAKELSMVERNDKGKQARAYFIECERRAHQPRVDPSRILNDPSALRGLLANYTEKVIALQQENAALAPKAEALDRIATAQGSLCITDAAKALQIPPRTLFDYLQRKRWIYRRHGTGWLGYSDKSQAGLVEHKVTTLERPDGNDKVTEQVRITPRGLAKLAEAFNWEEVS